MSKRERKKKKNLHTRIERDASDRDKMKIGKKTEHEANLRVYNQTNRQLLELFSKWKHKIRTNSVRWLWNESSKATTCISQRTNFRFKCVTNSVQELSQSCGDSITIPSRRAQEMETIAWKQHRKVDINHNEKREQTHRERKTKKKKACRTAKNMWHRLLDLRISTIFCLPFRPFHRRFGHYAMQEHKIL